MANQPPPPICIAARDGRLAEVKRLLRAGAEVDTADARRLTPLLYAAREGHVAVVRHLLGQGAAVDGLPRGHSTPLLGATTRNQPAVVKLLLAAGARTDVKSKLSNFTPLIDAAWSGHAHLVRLLLPHDEKRLSREQALVLAAKEGRADCVRLLLAAGVDRERTRFRGKTALQWARQKRHRDVVALLVV